MPAIWVDSGCKPCTMMTALAAFIGGTNNSPHLTFIRRLFSSPARWSSPTNYTARRSYAFCMTNQESGKRLYHSLMMKTHYGAGGHLLYDHTPRSLYRLVQKKCPLFENSRPSVAWQSDLPMHGPISKFRKVWLNSLKLSPFIFPNPVLLVFNVKQHNII